jgi:hypothetical protein
MNADQRAEYARRLHEQQSEAIRKLEQLSDAELIATTFHLGQGNSIIRWS